MAKLVMACDAGDVAEGRGLAVDLDGLRVAIFQDGGEFHALYGRCPHASGPLGHGWVEDGEAVCPLHRWRFKLSSGRCTTDTAFSVHRFRCEVRDGKVWVEV